jgi:hypothetical protein
LQLEPVLGTELIRLAQLPCGPFVSNMSKFDEAWIQHPTISEVYAYADTRPEALVQYFRIGEAIYKIDGMTYWTAPAPILEEVKELAFGLHG